MIKSFLFFNNIHFLIHTVTYYDYGHNIGILLAYYGTMGIILIRDHWFLGKQQHCQHSLQGVLLHPGVGIHALELPLDLVLEGLLLLLLTAVHDGIRDHGAGLILNRWEQWQIGRMMRMIIYCMPTMKLWCSFSTTIIEVIENHLHITRITVFCSFSKVPINIYQ